MMRNELPAGHECIYKELYEHQCQLLKLYGIMDDESETTKNLTARMCAGPSISLPRNPLVRSPEWPSSPADRRPTTPIVSYSLSPDVDPIADSETETVPMGSDGSSDTEVEPVRPPTPYYVRYTLKSKPGERPEWKETVGGMGGASPGDFQDLEPFMARLAEEDSPLNDLDTSTPAEWSDSDLYPVAPPPLMEVRHVIHVDSDGETEVHFEPRECTPPPNQLACSWCVDDEPSSPDVDRPRRRSRKRREDFSHDELFKRKNTSPF